MKLEKCIAQLEDLRKDRESFINGNEDFSSIFKADAEAIDTALAAIEDLKKAKRLLMEAVDGYRRLGKELDDHCELENFDCADCPLNGGGNCKSWKFKKAAMEIVERRY